MFFLFTELSFYQYPNVKAMTLEWIAMEQFIRYDSIEEAITAAIHRSGKTVKQIACALQPDKKAERANAYLNEALNPNKEQKLSMDEIIFICKETQQFQPLYYMADECKHTRPKPTVVETEKNEISSMLHDAATLISRAEQMFRDAKKEEFKLSIVNSEY